MGVYDKRPMTAHEEYFEKYVNESQALNDIHSEIVEWVRCRDIGLEAIDIYDRHRGYNVDQFLHLCWFLHHIATYDQAELEFQCQRKNKKKDCFELQWAMGQWMQAAAMQDAAATADAARRFNYLRQCLMPDMKFLLTVAAPQEARQEERPASNQTVLPTESGSLSEQVRERRRSDEAKRLRSKSAIESRQRAQVNENQTRSSNEAGRSTQHGQSTALSHKVIPAQSHGQVQPASEKPGTIFLFTPEELEKFDDEYLCFYPRKKPPMPERASPMPLLAETNALVRAMVVPQMVPKMDASVRARHEQEAGISQAEIGNAAGAGDQGIGSDRQPSTEPSSQASSSEGGMSTPPSSPQSPITPTHDQGLEDRFHANGNVIISDSRQLAKCRLMI